MVAMHFLLIHKAMATSAGIVCLILNKLLILSIREHFVEYKENYILQVLIALILCAFFRKTTKHPQLGVISRHQQRKEQGTRFGILTGVFYLTS